MPSMQQRQLKTPEGTVAYWTNKSATSTEPTLVFLPGLTADHRLFDKQIEYFKDKLTCHVWDAPSHGASRPFPLTWTLDDLANYLDALLLQEGVSQPIFVGQSLGGCIAQVYLELFPGKTAGFVSIDSCPLQRSYYAGWEIAFLKHTHAMYNAIPWKLLLSWGADTCATSEYGRTLMRTMMEDYKKLEYVDLTAHGYRALAEATEADRPYRITCPALILCGTKDKAGSMLRYNKTWEQRSSLPFAWIEGAGHNSNTDRPAEVNKLIEGFANITIHQDAPASNS